MKSNKVSYADRQFPLSFLPCNISINKGASACTGVLGAFSHLQREHRKHDIHVATLRAQSEFESSGMHHRWSTSWRQLRDMLKLSKIGWDHIGLTGFPRLSQNLWIKFHSVSCCLADVWFLGRWRDLGAHSSRKCSTNFRWEEDVCILLSHIRFLQYLTTFFVIKVLLKHVVLSRLLPRKKTRAMILFGSKSPLPRAVESKGLAKALPQTVVLSTQILKTIQQQEGAIKRQGNDPGSLRSDLPLRSPCLS